MDDARATVSFRLRGADPDFLYKLALPTAAVLPASTPSRQAPGARARAGEATIRLPATGPYMVAEYVAGRRLRLVRNPRFREWSRAAQPAGYPDDIAVSLGLPSARQVAAMERGEADLMSSVGPAPSRHQALLRQRLASQLHVNPLPATDFYFLNTRVAPLDDVRVRRALNYALDRRRIVEIYGGSNTAQVTCQLLPPQIPGYRPYCPYTRHPTSSGRWRGPNMAKARALVAASGTAGMRVLVWVDRVPIFLQESRYIVSVLRRLGYDAALRVLPTGRFWRYTNDSRNRAQVISGGWSVDYPAASSMLVKLTCPYFTPASEDSHDASEFCDLAIDRKISRATALQTAHPEAAESLWARIDRELVDRAIWLPTVNPKMTDIVSRRTGNYRYHLMYGALIDQLWVH